VHQVIVIGYLFGLPHHGDVLQLVYFHALCRHSFRKHRIDLVAMNLIVEGKVEGFVGDYLQAYLAQLISPFK
jgi:hypothetical protein